MTTTRIPTRRSAAKRALDHWLGAALVYALAAATFIAANWEKF